MRILATSDLHGRRDWFQWILNVAPRFDAIAIAGDIIDQDSDPILQIAFIRRWVENVHKTGTRLLLTDGNHDMAIQPQWPRNEPSSKWADFVTRAQLEETWMHALAQEGADMVAGMTKVVTNGGQLLVTSLQYGREHESANETALQGAAKIRRALPVRWLVLHHEPPPGLLGHPAVSSPALGEWIERFQPDVVLVGHDHEAPARHGTCVEKFGITRVINAGQDSRRKHPACVELDMTSLRFLWRK